MVSDEALDARARVAALMAAMAAEVATGGSAALFAFVRECEAPLTAAVRHVLRELHRPDVARDEDELAWLVLAGALVIRERAGAWRPDGAQPWTWAAKAIRAEVVRVIGHPSIELDPDRLDGRQLEASIAAHPAGGRSGGTAAPSELERIAAVDERAALLVEAIASVGSARDQAVHIQYGIQKHLGDRSPARTVGAEFGLAPDNVRQIDLRMRRRLRRLAESEARFVPLLGTRWLAA